MGGDEPADLCLIDASGAIIDLDEAFAQLLELPAWAHAVGRPLTTVVPELSSLPEHGSYRVLRTAPSGVIEIACRSSPALLGHAVLARRLSDSQRELEIVRRQLDVI